jgi:4-hydroxybenzoate polyprenyltransferase
MPFEPVPTPELTARSGSQWALIAAFVESLRPHQWLKNLLLFVPLVAAHRLNDGHLLGQTARAFVAFSLCASAVYIFNDIHDRPADRLHPHKRFRAIASGRLPWQLAVGGIPALILAANIVAVGAHPALPVLLSIYIGLQIAYTFWLKAVILLDAFVLATGYTLRVYAGEIVTGLPPPFELLLLCALLFLSLALLKRYTELSLLRARDGAGAHARSYLLEDLDFVLALGVGSGLLAVQLFGLYLSAGAVPERSSRDLLIWLACVTLLYWISRMWLKAHRGQMTDDPLVFVITDKASLCLLALTGVSAWLAV